MRFIRYRDRSGAIHYGSELATGGALRVDGDGFGAYQVSQEPAEVTELLAPIAPSQILCIGLNYRRHAEETNAKIPSNPILFLKGVNALQDPSKPIFLPVALASSEVDYEGELAVVIGKACKN